jgi:hypothetical protein
MKTAKALFGILTITAALAVQVQAQTFLTNGLVAYYPFNGNANDASGNGNDGTNFNASLSIDRFGNANRSYYFNGSNAWISVPPSAALQPATNAGYTISIWVKCVGANTSRLNTGPVMVNEHNFTPQPGFDFFVGADNNVSFQSSGAYGNEFQCQIQANVWTHYVCTWDGANTRQVALYKNGVFVSDYTNYFWGQASPEPLQIGAQFGPANSYSFDSSGVGCYWWGQLDDIRIYNRLLSSNEVAQLDAIESAPIVHIQKAVYLDSSNLWTGSNYQVQASTDLINWTNQGSVFTATTNYWRSTNYWDVANWNQLFFRLQLAP